MRRERRSVVAVEWIVAPSTVAARTSDAGTHKAMSERSTSIRVFIGITLQEFWNRKGTITAVLGVQFPDTGDLREAIEHLKEAARLDPENLQVRLDRIPIL